MNAGPVDQAAGLRRRIDPPARPILPAMAFTGGKGGVGKTCLAVNTSVQLAALGLRPLLVDWDLGLANADVLLDQQPEHTLFDVIAERRLPVSEIIAPVHGVGLLPAASGVQELTRLSDAQLDGLLAELGRVASDYDCLVFDTAAGIAREVIAALAVSRVQVVVVTPDPTSLTDAYALIKVLTTTSDGPTDIRVIANQVADQDEAMRVFNRLRKVVAGYLDTDIRLLGHLSRSRALADSIRARRPLALQPDTSFSRELQPMTRKLKSLGWKRKAAPPTPASKTAP